MLAIATDQIWAVYESQPLLTEVGSFPPPGSSEVVEKEEDEGDAS